ncbi:hypothetical protein QOT17_003949 [Balamuthia mandrillaris]
MGISNTFCPKCIYQALTPHYRNFSPSAVEQTGSGEEEPQHTGECPLCRATVHKSRVHANHALAGLLSELLVRCRNEERGCPAVVAVSDKQAHEAVCEFAAAECPFWTLGCAWNATSKRDTLSKSSRMELELNEEEEDKKQKEADETEEEEDEEAPQTDKKRKGNACQKLESIKDSASSSTEPSQPATPPTLVIKTLGKTTRDIDACNTSHDCSIRVWDMRGVPGGPTRSPQVECSQALTGHKYSIWALQCTNGDMGHKNV